MRASSVAAVVGVVDSHYYFSPWVVEQLEGFVVVDFRQDFLCALSDFRNDFGDGPRPYRERVRFDIVTCRVAYSSPVLHKRDSTKSSELRWRWRKGRWGGRGRGGGAALPPPNCSPLPQGADLPWNSSRGRFVLAKEVRGQSSLVLYFKIISDQWSFFFY